MELETSKDFKVKEMIVDNAFDTPSKGVAHATLRVVSSYYSFSLFSLAFFPFSSLLAIPVGDAI